MYLNWSTHSNKREGRREEGEREGGREGEGRGRVKHSANNSYLILV